MALRSRAQKWLAELYRASLLHMRQCDPFFAALWSHDRSQGYPHPEPLEPRLLPSSTLEGSVFSDLNADGQRQATEQSLGGWTVYADLNTNAVHDPSEPLAISDSTGSYALAVAGGGGYRLGVVAPGHATITSPQGGYHDVVVADGSTLGQLDFGIQDTSLLVHWRFDEGQGTTAEDSSGHGRTAYLDGADWATDGAFSNSALLPSGGGIIEDSSGPHYLNGLSELTAAVWVKSDSTSVDAAILGGVDDLNTVHDNPFSLRYDAAGLYGGGTSVIKIALSTDQAGVQYESSSSVQSTDWQHLAFTWKAGEGFRLYINGRLDTPTFHGSGAKSGDFRPDGGAPTVAGVLAGLARLTIGEGAKPAADWRGLIDDVQIYSRALSRDEINRVMHSQTIHRIAAAGADEVDEGAVYTLSLAATPGPAISRWIVDWGDGVIDEIIGGATFAEHVYADGESMSTISVTAEDVDGAMYSAYPLDVVVRDVAPVLSIEAEAITPEEAPFVITLNREDPGDDTLTWTIDWGDGTVEEVPAGALTAEHFYLAGEAGWTATVTASDDDGTYAVGTASSQRSPSAAAGLQVTPQPGGTALTLEWLESSLLVGNAIKVEMSTDGVAFSEIASVGEGVLTHLVTGLDTATDYTFRLRTENGGLYSAYSPTVTAATSSPVSISGASEVAEAADYEINLINSGSALTEWTVDWGDGNIEVFPGSSTMASHVYVDGNDELVVSVTASDGTRSYEAGSIDLHAADVAPVLSVVGPSNFTTGSTYTLSLSSSDVGSDTVFQWFVHWGDGTEVATFGAGAGTIEHVYTVDGNYVIQAVAVDEEGSHLATPLLVTGATFSGGNAVLGEGAYDGNFSTESGSSLDSGISYNDGILLVPDDGGGTQVSTTGEGVVDVSPTGTLDGWTIIEGGGSDTAKGSVALRGGNIELIEGDSFELGISRQVELASTDHTLRFTYFDLKFDSSSTPFIQDAFEVAILDEQGGSLVGPFRPGRDALFNLTDGQDLVAVSGVTITPNAAGDGAVVDVDVAAIAGRTVTFVARLVNNDQDTTTTVTLGGEESPIPPAIDPIVNLSGDEGYSVALTATFSDSNTSDTHTAIVHWGDLTSSAAVIDRVAGTISASHVYADNGTYNVVVVLSDSGGTTTTASTSAHIANVRPELNVSLSFEATQGKKPADRLLAAVIAGTFTDPGFTRLMSGTSETFTTTIDWGDGTVRRIANDVQQGGENKRTSGSFAGSHVYAQPGEYTVTVTVQDDDGGQASQVFNHGVIKIDVVQQINLKAENGTVPVKIFRTGSHTLDEIIVSSLRFGPGGAHEQNGGSLQDKKHQMTHFRMGDAAIRPNDEVAFLYGTYSDGTPFVGMDTIRIVHGSQQGRNGVVPGGVEPRFLFVDQNDLSVRRVTNSGGDAGYLPYEQYHFDYVTRPSGVTMTAGGDRIWSITEHGQVVITSDTGETLGAWTAGDVKRATGIALAGNDLWVVDADRDQVLLYANAADSLQGVKTTAVRFDLDPLNGSASDIAVADGRVWVVDDGAGSVFVYDIVGSGLAYLQKLALDPANVAPSGIVVAENEVWVADRVAHSIFHYDQSGQLAWGPFIETGGAVVLEAESFDTSVSQGNHEWQVVADANASGGSVVVATPNIGTGYDTEYVASSPRLDYQIDFATAGTYYVWIRGTGGGADDSIHAGLDGQAVSTADRISSFSLSTFKWSRSTMDGAVATINVATAGVHTLNLWMREDGFTFDKIILTTDSSFNPTSLGPSESERRDTRSLGSAMLVQSIIQLDSGVLVEGLAQPAPQPIPTASGRARPDFGDLVDITSEFTVSYGETSFNGDTRRLFTDVTLQRSAVQDVRGRLLLAIANITSPGVSVDQPHGYIGGAAYVDLTEYLSQDGSGFFTSPSETFTISLRFANATGEQFDYDLYLLSEANAAPAFISDPYNDVQGDGYLVERPADAANPANDAAGVVQYLELVRRPDATTRLEYQLAAVDPDGDAVSFSVISAPAGLNASDLLRDLDGDGVAETLVIEGMAATLPAAGAYTLRLRVADQHGAYSAANDQQFVVNLIDAPANRPPQFTSSPVVEAYSGVDYLYQATAQDADGDAPLVFSGEAWYEDGGVRYDLDGTVGAGEVESGLSGAALMSIESDGRVVWIPEVNLIGLVARVNLIVSDGNGGEAEQQYAIRVIQDLTNNDPVIISTPTEQFYLPATPTPSLDPVTPDAITITLAEGQTVTLPVSIDLAADGSSADLVFLVDTSASMGQAVQWLGDVISQVDAELAAYNITNNRYGLVRFESSPSVVQVGGRLFGSAAEFATAIDTIGLSGGTEDGYEALTFALNQYTFRQDAAAGFVIVTDEDADDFSSATRDAILQAVNGDPGTTEDDLLLFGVLNARYDIGYRNPFNVTSSNWEMVNDHWRATSTDALAPAIAVMNVGSPSFFTSTEFRILDAGTDKEALFTFDYQDGGNYKYVRVSADTDQMVIGEVVAGADSQSGQYSIGGDLAYGETAWLYLDLYQEHVYADLYDSSGDVYASAGHTYGDVVSDGQIGIGAQAGIVEYRSVYVDDYQGYYIDVNFSLGGAIAYSLGVEPPVNEASSSLGYIADGQGGYYEQDGAEFSYGDGNTFQHYVELIFDAGDVVWDLNHLRGTPSADIYQSFSSAFAEVMADRVLDQLSVDVVSSSPLFDGYQLDPSGGPRSFLVDLTGDGRAHSFTIDFLQDGLLAGSIPVAVNAAYTYDLRAIDPDGDQPLVFSWTEGTEHHGATLVDGKVSWNPTATGDYFFSVTVDDGRGGTDVQEWTVTVGDGGSTSNQSPTIAPQSVPEAQSWRPWEFGIDADDQDGDQLAYYLWPDPVTGATAPAGMAIDRNTGVVSWTPTSDQEGSQTFTVLVSDGRGGEAVGSFTVDVVPPSAVNSAPTLEGEPDQIVAVGATYQYQPAVSDSDGDALRFNLVLSPEGMAVDPTSGHVVWSPGADQLGAHSAILRVSDGTASTLQAFTVTVVEVNAAPIIASIPSGPAAADQLWQYQVDAADANGDELTYQLLVGPSGAGFSTGTAGLLEWAVPSGQAAGQYRFEIAVLDGRGGVATQEFWLEVAANAAPSFDFGDAGPLVVGNAWSLEILASDPEGDPLTYTLDVDARARGMQIEDINGYQHLTWTPGQQGTYSATVTVSDGTTSVSRKLTLPVNPAPSNNIPPEFTSTPTGPALRGREWSYVLTAQDLNGDAIELSLTDSPDGATVTGSNGQWTIAWTPPADGTAGYASFTVRVAEVATPGNFGEQTFTLAVVENAPPVVVSGIRYAVADRDTAVDLDFNIIDLNGDGVSLEVVEGLGQAEFIDLTTGDPVTSLASVSNDLANPTALRLSYTPMEFGEQDVVIRITDSKGASTTYTFQLLVRDTTQAAPQFTYTGRSTVALGDTFEGQIDATDPNGDSLTYTLVNPDPMREPTGMWIDAMTGHVFWTPTAGQLTGAGELPYVYQIQVSDGQFDVLTDAIEITVVSQVTNQAPSITSEPAGNAIVGQRYVYQATAEDPDNDRRVWLLDEGPSGAALDPDTGRFTWTPTLADFESGPAAVTIRVVDQYGAGQTQSFELPVRAINSPPLIVSTPPTEAATGTPYTYLIRTSDADGDDISFELAGDLVDASGQPLTNVKLESLGGGSARFIWWTPDRNAQITITASDGRGGSHSQTYNLEVSSGLQDTPPVFESSPTLSVAAGATYGYTAYAFDPNGAVTYDLDQAAKDAGLTIDPASGLVQWVPGSGQIGSTPVTVTATQGGYVAYQSFTITVTDPALRQQPQISPDLDLAITEGAVFRYTISANDPDGEPLEYWLLDGQEQVKQLTVDGRTMRIDDYGRITWEAGEEGAAAFSVRVVDTDGYTAEGEFRISVLQDTAPSAAIFVSDVKPAPGDRIAVRVQASDDVGISDIRLKVTGGGLPAEGQYLAVAGDGSAIFDVPVGDAAGTLYTFTATAIDSRGQESAPVDALVTITEPDITAPVVELVTPYSGTRLESPMPLVGRVYDDVGVVYYRVIAVPQDGGDAVVLAEVGDVAGTTYHDVGDAANAGEIGEIQNNDVLPALDPSLLANGAYSIYVQAIDGSGNAVTSSPLNVTVDSLYKLGNFSLSFTDLTVPVLNTPITIGRSYDTLQADEKGDFGYGWKLNLYTIDLDIDIQGVSPMAGGLEFPELGYRPAFREGTQIAVKLPDGTSVNFTVVPESLPGYGGFLSYYGVTYSMAFVSDTSGVTLKLTGSDPQFTLNDYGQFVSSGIPYNPIDHDRDFVLTTADGTEYYIDSATGDLRHITDRDDNRLEINDDGIIARNSDGEAIEAVTITRDGEGRITAVTDPAGKSIIYDYDPTTGDLLSVTGRDGNTLATYAYGETTWSEVEFDMPQHILTSISNVMDVQVLKIGFDGDGRVKQIQDASGAEAGFTYTIDGPTVGLPAGYTVEVVSDADDVPTEIVRNAAGDTVRRLQRLSDAGTSDPADDIWLVSAFKYDSDHNQKVIWTPFEAVGGARYTADPDVVSTRESESEYDSFGNLIWQQDATGARVSYQNYDAYGNPGRIISPNGTVTENAFSNGRLTQTVVRDGQTVLSRTTYGYNNGNLETLTQYDDAGNAIVSGQYEYDAAGRLLQATETDPDGEGVGSLEPVTHYFAYDAAGNQTHSWHVWTNPDNATDQKTLVTVTAYEEEGRTTGSARYTIDGELDRTAVLAQTSTIPASWATDGADSYSTTQYNAAGQVVKTFDRFGNESQTIYDARGNVIESRTRAADAAGDYDTDGNGTIWIVTRTYYDTNGRAVASSDPFVMEDTGPNAVLMPQADLRVTHTLYDALGRVTETRRLQGLSITLVADALNASFLKADFPSGYSDPASPDYIANWETAHLLSSTQTFYNAAGRVSHTVAATGATTYYEYDAAGRQSAVWQDHDLDGVYTQGVDAKTTYTYDNEGRQRTVTDALGHVTEFTYDALGRVTKTTAYGDATTADDDVITRTEYDALGRRAAAIDPLGRRTEYSYDNAGRLLGVTLPEVTDTAVPGGTGSDTGTPTYSYTYDRYGNQTRITDPIGNTTTQDPDDRTTRFVFDHLGRQVFRILPLGQSIADPQAGQAFVESSVYDDRSLAAITAVGGTLALSTGMGQLARTIDFEGRVTQYLYDNTATGGGRLVEKRYFDSLADFGGGIIARTVTYSYDAFGRQVAVLDTGHGGAASPSTTTYDADGRVTKQVTPEGTLNYAYDALGRHTRTWTGDTAASDEGGSPTTETVYSYDALGRLQTVTQTWRGGVDIADEATTYHYDLLGNLDATVSGVTNITADYQYDAHNRLEALYHFVDNGDQVYEAGVDLTPIALFQYTVDDAGKRTAAHEVVDGITYDWSWTYDALNRLVREQLDASDDSLDYTGTYSFDLASNRKTRTHDAPGTIDDYTVTSVHDDNDRLLSETRTGADASYTTYRYGDYANADGHDDATVQTQKAIWTDATQTTLTSQTRFSYDATGRMTQVEVDADGDGIYETTTTYTYDDRGLRVTETTGGVTKQYLFDPQNPTGYAQVLEEYVSDVLERSYTLGHDVISQHDAAHGSLTMLHDGHGSTRALLDAAAATVQAFAYDAYGNHLVSATAGLTSAADAWTRLLYSGEWTNTRGEQYLRARWYNPQTGRFNRLDPWAGNTSDPVSLHKYLYTHASPVMGVDPAGLFFTYVGQLVGMSIRSLMRSPKVIAAVKAADTASTVADAVEIIGALAVGGPAALANPALLAGLLLNIAPFGGVLKKIGVADNILKKVGGRLSSAVAGKVDDAAEGLTDAFAGMRRAGLAGNKAVQSVGDMGALATARGLGFDFVRDFPVHYRGFDGIFKNGDNWVIAEAKGGVGTLGTTVANGGQMSRRWINGHIDQLSQRGYHSWASKLAKARDEGRIQGLVVSTPVDTFSGTVGDPTFTLKQWGQIQENVF